MRSEKKLVGKKWWQMTCCHDKWQHVGNMLATFPTKGNDVNGKKIKQDSFWDPPKLRKFMLHNVSKIFSLTSNFEMVLLLSTKIAVGWFPYSLRHSRCTWNESSWLNCLDESAMSILNEHYQNWMCIKQKLHPFGISCCLLSIIFGMEHVETEEDQSMEGLHVTSEFEVWWRHAKDSSPLCTND